MKMGNFENLMQTAELFQPILCLKTFSIRQCYLKIDTSLKKRLISVNPEWMLFGACKISFNSMQVLGLCICLPVSTCLFVCLSVYFYVCLSVCVCGCVEMCLEKRVFFRLISGFHTSITVDVTANWLVPGTVQSSLSASSSSSLLSSFYPSSL